MRHSLTVEGYGIRLRPVQIEDASFIVWLRNLDFVKGRVGDSAVNVAAQERWLNEYFQREGDYYFIVETSNGTPLGTYSIYNVNGTSAEIGRLIVRRGVSASIPASLLLLDLCYDYMGVTQVLADSVAGNFAVHSLLRKHGFKDVRGERAHQVIAGDSVELLPFVQSIRDWPAIRAMGVPKAERVEPRIRQWEQEYLGRFGAQEPQRIFDHPFPQPLVAG